MLSSQVIPYNYVYSFYFNKSIDFTSGGVIQWEMDRRHGRDNYWMTRRATALVEYFHLCLTVYDYCLTKK